MAGSVQANHDLATVSLSGFSTTPNVIATVGSFAGGAPVTPRIHNVSLTQFQVQVQEEEGSDGLHATETISYIAFESGSGQAGNLDYVGGNTGRTVTQNSSSISLGPHFSASPIFLAAVSSRYGADPVGLRTDGITATRANVYLQEEQSKDAEVGHTTENVSFLAIEPGFVVAEQNDNGTNQPPTISNQSFSVDENAAASTLVGTVQASDPDGDAMTYSINGGNSANAFTIDGAGRIRVSNPAELATRTQFVLTVQVADVESHTATAEVTINVNPVVVSTSEIGEIGTITRAQASRNTWHTVNFSRAYSNPVVVMGPLSSRVNVPSLVRVRNVTANSFQWQIDEWDYLDGVHGTETASYMVIEAGTHTLSNGTRLVAGKANVNHQAINVNLPGLNGKPVVLATVASVKGSSAVTTRINNVTGNGFRIRLQEEEGNDGRHARENVSYVAVEQGAGISDGKPFVVSTGSASHSKSTVSFGASLGVTPALFANMQSFNGGDVASLRYSSLSATKFDVIVREEQSKDKELNHATETIGFFAMPTGTISVANAGSAGIRNSNTGRAQAIGNPENMQDRSAVEAYRQSRESRPTRKTTDIPLPLNSLSVEAAFHHVELAAMLESLF